MRAPLADSTLMKVPEKLLGEEALLAGDVLSTGWFGSANGGVARGSLVAVVGCGAVGICAVAAAIELGAERVVAVDPRWTASDSPNASVARASVRRVRSETARAMTMGRGVDVVVEAVGSPAASRLAFELVRVGGAISAVGVHHEPALAISPGALYDKNLTYRAGRCRRAPISIARWRWSQRVAFRSASWCRIACRSRRRRWPTRRSIVARPVGRKWSSRPLDNPRSIRRYSASVF